MRRRIAAWILGVTLWDIDLMFQSKMLRERFKDRAKRPLDDCYD
jgi:hypothetical protein